MLIAVVNRVGILGPSLSHGNRAVATEIFPEVLSIFTMFLTETSDADPDTKTPYLQIENVSKVFDKFVAIHDIYLDVYPGEFVCLLGPSGCGKTTLLRIIAGLEQQTTGRVIQAGKDISRLPPSKRDFGIVFQSYALFPNLTAWQNVAYGLHNTGIPKAEIHTRVDALLNLVGLAGFSQKYPSQLSGGQQQRVALARALALSPGLLLLDEPLSALDAKVRASLRSEITQLQKRLGVTTVMVTHDQTEALAMADRIVVMDRGHIVQVGPPREIYQQPLTPFVANFIGVMNTLPGVVLAETGGGSDRTLGLIRCGLLTLTADLDGLPVDTFVEVAIRPEDIQVLGLLGAYELSPPLAEPDTLLANQLEATVTSVEFLGTGYRLVIQLQAHPEQTLLVDLSANDARQWEIGVGRSLYIQLPPHLIRIFPAKPTATPGRPLPTSQPSTPVIEPS